MDRRHFLKILAGSSALFTLKPYKCVEILTTKQSITVSSLTVSKMSDAMTKIYAPQLVELFERNMMLYDTFNSLSKKPPIDKTGDGYYFKLSP